MSHFAVMVIGSNVEEQLAPFHEFECTGVNDQYVQDIDVLEEYRARFEKETTRLFESPEGELFSRYEDRFYRDPTGEEREKIGERIGSFGSSNGISYSTKDWGRGEMETKVHYLPEGWKEVEKPLSEIESFAEHIQDYYGFSKVEVGQEPDLEEDHKFGYFTVDEDGEVVKAVNRTNPNAKWDWYQLGGRWTGFLKLNSGARGEAGTPGLMTPGCKLGYADAALKGDIDFEGMREDSAKEAGDMWDNIHAIINGRAWKTFKEVLEQYEGQEDAGRKAREEYHSQDVLNDISERINNPFFDVDKFRIERVDYVQQARQNATTVYAFIKDSQWYAKGDMGWFGMSDDKVSEDEWARKFNEMLDELPDDTQISIVDCHI